MKRQNFETSLTRQKSRSSLFQVGCVRGANTFPNHNQSLTPRVSDKTSTTGFLVALELLGGDSNEPIQANEQTLQRDLNRQPMSRADIFFGVRQQRGQSCWLRANTHTQENPPVTG